MRKIYLFGTEKDALNALRNGIGHRDDRVPISSGQYNMLSGIEHQENKSIVDKIKGFLCPIKYAEIKTIPLQ